MKITESTLRRLIRETLLTEAAMTPQMALEAGVWFKVLKQADNVCIWARASGRDGSVGTLFSSVTNDPCSDAWEIVFAKVRPEFSGLGPLMYDLMIDMINPHPLMSDRKVVSNDAKRVWDYYRDRRRDIKQVQLDDELNTLTPEPDDNCAQKSSKLHDKDDWVGSSLSKAYRRKSGATPTFDELNSLGLIGFK
jgi:hypothetical protein